DGFGILSCGESAAGRRARKAAESIANVDLYTIIFLALAVVIFLRLRSVLGQRTGRERPPYDPYSARDAVRSPSTTDKVVTLPTSRAAGPAARVAEAVEPSGRWQGEVVTGTPTAPMRAG